MKWIVAWRGGRGPNEWDHETVIEADNIRAALDQMEPKVKEAGGEIFMIEQHP